MRRIICMLLALILCLAIPMAAFAAGTPSIGNESPKTGDMANMELWVPMLIASALALVSLMVVYVKKFRKAN